MKYISPEGLRCTCCKEEFSPTIEGMTPEESGYVLIEDKPYCCNCWDIDNNGYVINGEPYVEEGHLLEEYCDNIVFEYLDIPTLEEKKIKRIQANIKGSSIRIDLKWHLRTECLLAINNVDIGYVNGYMNLVSVIENNILVSADENDYELSAEKFIDSRNTFVEPIWQCMRVLADGRFADNLVPLYFENRPFKKW